MIRRFSALLLAAALLTPALASAQTVQPVAPCIGCAISQISNANQVLVNQLLVRQTLQNGLNTQLQTQSQSLENQRLARAAQINAALQGNTAELQRLLILEQLNLIQLEGHAVGPAAHRPPAPAKKGDTPKKSPAAASQSQTP